MSLKLLIAILATAGFAAEFSPEQLEAKFPWDLGAARIDQEVSKYPPEMQERYALFLQNCSQCHSTARPLNSRYVSRADWTRYTKRMHLRSKTTPNASLAQADLKEAVEFLIYDSQRRKVERKAEFDAETARLEKLFSQVQIERAKRREMQNKAKSKPYNDPIRVNPQGGR